MRALAVIPARGGSKGIPRKNLRLIHGKPLIACAIEACHAASRLTKTVVSTEDEEIAVVARRFGAEVLDRPPELAGDAVPLAPVLYDAVRQLEARGEVFDVVATVQPTSPLIRPETLDRAVALFEDDPKTDTVLSVYDNTHLNWTVDDRGRGVPLFEKRVNRQQLPRIYTESGGIIASRRSVVTERERLGTRVRLVVLDADEAIDIDTYHDWWLAEKVIGRRRIVFHVVGSPENGLGHVYRALTLAHRLTDHEIVFLAAEDQHLAAGVIQSRHFPVHVYRESPLERLDGLEPDIVVNDVLDTDAETVLAMKERGWRVVNFEDMGTGVDHADVAINALYEAPHEADHVYTGSDYYCMREEFFSVRRREAAPQVARVLVCFGGTDPSGLTVKALEALGRLDPTFQVGVIVGAGFGQEDALGAACRCLPEGCDVVRDTRVISHYMEQADLMLTSGGRTCYEAAAVGVPTIVLCQNQRELTHQFARAEHGFLNLGLGRDVPAEALADEVRKLMADYDRRKDMQRRMWQWEGMAGIGRVLRLLLGEEQTEEVPHAV